MDKKFRTSDLAMAAYLSLTYPVEDIDFSNPKRATFIFTENEGLLKQMSDYLSGQASVEPHKFSVQIKTLKSRIFEGRGYERREDGTTRS